MVQLKFNEGVKFYFNDLPFLFHLLSRYSFVCVYICILETQICTNSLCLDVGSSGYYSMGLRVGAKVKKCNANKISHPLLRSSWCNEYVTSAADPPVSFTPVEIHKL